MNRNPVISALGTSALLFDVPGALCLDTQKRIWALARSAAAWPDVREAVPCLNNLMVTLMQPPAKNIDALRERLIDEWSKGDLLDIRGSTFEISVDYGGEFGPRMEHVCDHTGLTVDEVVERHSAPTYVVYGLGSHPGHCYLGGMDASLATPRRKTPALDNRGGSVSIGGVQTSVSVSNGPTGWNAIGHTNAVFFDLLRNPAAIMKPGDSIRFVPGKVVR